MKTPETIKKGLVYCNANHPNCSGCPYDTDRDYEAECLDAIQADALDYIEQLERENASLDKAVRDAAELMVSGTALMSKRIEELERERDAALEALKAYKWYEGESNA